ncbi:type II secretion system minor pseudopilin GspK [Pseudoalteromonas luteoviolacea]|uniref:Type II secretion system protein K n=1 Tax=Pseudoalteromonas luteoviolacea S4054 TaxID=1129367 RepID=A0A0F6A651_9GAMM|nr:type II secretion system minor pseudopilin GspK [Pseudoalteromonas luteoviolacea]AOT06750.1 general secretion pathway protein GspK [Pseudoalteromonas luteoviolacea]AOT11668.1 general secretion pathway protein GspK [Pseudoalteromonas luteoviolacea]AOT16580.1 general secretion pathway protein GspK [Pseudoalteromonas luteoviolacea]KKE80904.1 general secretion pathway protein K [Pseudoalteromonas luteoviolacea S4054]KZN73877.1 general secretion pathway protein K [Pseudoalteromonas luteoviolacea
MRKQQGAALIIVLFIVALAASLAAEMSSSLMVQVQKAANIQTHQQAKWYSYGTEELVKKVLLESRKDDPDKVHLGQPWAIDEVPYPVDHGTLSGKITDLQACLNLNALRAPKEQNAKSTDTNPAHRALLELLKNIEDLPAQESEEAMADSVYDWLDEDSITYRSGAEEDEYMSRQMPYMTANNLMASESELRVIKGFNPLVMEKLLPYVCVIPGSTDLAINVNTVLPEQALLLSALLDGLSLSGAEAVIAARPEEGFDNLQDFFSEVKNQGAQDTKKAEKIFTITSNYFKLRAKASFDERLFKMTSILEIKDGRATVLARKFGGVQ